MLTLFLLDEANKSHKDDSWGIKVQDILVQKTAKEQDGD